MAPLFTKKFYAACFITVFLVEAVLSLWTGLPYDMQVWFNTGTWMNKGINVYLPNDHLGYPPLWAFWCSAAVRIFNFFGNNMEIFRLAIKLPLILSQLILAFAVGEYAKSRFDARKAKKLFLVTLTWSFFFYIGAIWGQIDVLSALLTFLAFYAVASNRTSIGALFLGIAVALKIYPLITLPAFFAYILKKKGRIEAGKFLLYSSAFPVVFTLIVFAAFRWDILYLFRTVFYWAPILESKNPIQIQGGCMNLWSFISLFQIDIAKFWQLRLVWIPFMALTSIYWLKKPMKGESDLNLSIISLYVVFLIAYGWVSEQIFTDPLPFIFLQIIAFYPNRRQFYSLIIIQILVFAFSATNWGPFIFEPLFARFSPLLLQKIQIMSPATNPTLWNIRGILGLTISASLVGFLLLMLREPTKKKPK